MTSTDLPLKRRVLIGGIVGFVGGGIIAAALAFPAVTAPDTLPELTASSRPAATESAPTAEESSSSPEEAPVPTSRAPQVPNQSPVQQDPAETPVPGAVELPQSAPVRVRIPSIGVDAGTVALGLDGNELETPADPDVVGWFVGAQTPGAPGRAVLAGHLTWNGRHTVFARLPDIAVGAVVEVDREDGTTARFQITSIETFAKDEFPTDEVYAATEEPSLVLITCGGDYSRADHYYDSNVIASAVALN